MYTFGDKIDFDFVANIRDKIDRVEVYFITNVYEALKTIYLERCDSATYY